MKTMMNNLREIWAYQESLSSNYVLKERISCIPNLNCYAGLIGITDAKMFQVEIDSTFTIHPNYLRKFQGVEIQVLPGKNDKSEFTIILLEQELTDVFILFIEDLVDKLTQADTTQMALTIINQRVNYWRQLFERVTGELLSPERQRGLFGELYFLRLLLDQSDDKLSALQSWQGSSGANQDFLHGTNAVEIKTSKAVHPAIHISNELQLDYTSLSHLFLCLITVNESTGNGESLGSIIEELAESLVAFPDLLQEFDLRLDLAGIRRNITEYYKGITFVVRSVRYFFVTNGFPALIATTYVNPAIHKVSYQIDLSACIPFETTEELVITTFFP